MPWSIRAVEPCDLGARRFGKSGIDLRRKQACLNHCTFHIGAKEGGHVAIRNGGHPPFAAMIMLNGREYVASRATERGVRFAKEGACFTGLADAPGLQLVADTVRSQDAIGLGWRQWANFMSHGGAMRMLRPLLYVWAFPATLLGLIVMALSLVSGGRVALIQGALEVHGGFATWFLSNRWLGFGWAAAMTLGHVILGRNPECLERSRRHEHVHIRQYERWGPLMLPMYMTASLVLWLRGRNAYLDNPFEVEAYGEAD